ncbi:integrase core domain-containing protein [Spirosoma daeguense]
MLLLSDSMEFSSGTGPPERSAYLFRNLAQVREVIDNWLTVYNTERPHQSSGFITPVEFKQAG